MTELAATIARLRDEFVHELPHRLAALEAEVAAAAAAPSRPTLTRVMSLAHRLRGTAGSYDLLAVSDAAGALEDLVAAALDGGTVPSLDLAAVRVAVEAALANAPAIEPGPTP